MYYLQQLFLAGDTGDKLDNDASGSSFDNVNVVKSDATYGIREHHKTYDYQGEDLKREISNKVQNIP